MLAPSAWRVVMASVKIVESLQQVAIFRDLEPSQLDELARQTERIKFAPGDFITRTGEAGSGAYLMVSGAAECLPDPGWRMRRKWCIRDPLSVSWPC